MECSETAKENKGRVDLIIQKNKINPVEELKL